MREVSQEEDPNAHSTNDLSTIARLNIIILVNEPIESAITYEGGSTIEVKVVDGATHLGCEDFDLPTGCQNVIPTGRPLEEDKELREPMGKLIQLGCVHECLSPIVVVDPNPKYLHGKEFVMFGLLIFWFALDWEAVIFRRTTHHLADVNNDPFLLLTTIKHLNFGKVNL